MPVDKTYPGVYIEEIPSGVRTITGVSTSVAAFIGRTKRGNASEPETIYSFGDFDRLFGGLWKDSKLGFAVRDFFLNGGTKAIVVRIHKGAEAAKIDLAKLPLVAANEGSWGDNLKIKIDHDTKDKGDDKLFNLTVKEVDPKTSQLINMERFLNVSADKKDPRFAPLVLEANSMLVKATKKDGEWDITGRPEPNAEGIEASKGTGKDGDLLSTGEFILPNTTKTGLYALEKADIFNILCIPPYTDTDDVDPELIAKAATYCEGRRAMLLVDPRSDWNSVRKVKDGLSALGTGSKNAAFFFPRLRQRNPLNDDQFEDFVPCGAVAGIFARTDTRRGVWKAPAGLDATLVGVPQLCVPLTDNENGELNPLGINCLRNMPAAGRVVWGSRTLEGADRLASEWKYIPVRRTALFIEETLYRGLQWVVFEPNDEPLWAQIRLNVGAFMNDLFRQGAFQGSTPREAYFVKCDKETTTQNDIDHGIVNIVVGFAPLKPAEFVVLKIQQIAGQIQT